MLNEPKICRYDLRLGEFRSVTIIALKMGIDFDEFTLKQAQLPKIIK
jgi:hypothetical protein